jgi:hypothetical protein
VVRDTIKEGCCFAVDVVEGKRGARGTYAFFRVRAGDSQFEKSYRHLPAITASVFWIMSIHGN